MDNTTVKDASDATVAIATDDVGAVHFQRVKLDVGGDGASVPVVGTVPVSGTVAVTGPLTDTQLRATPVPVSGAFYQTTQPVSGPLTDAQVRAADVKVSLDGEAVAVTGPLTDTQLRATPVPVSGTVSVTEPVTVDATDLDVRSLTSADVVTVTGGAGQVADVKVSLDGESVPVTGTFYQATQPVSGPLTDAQLRATAVPVSGSFSASAPTYPSWAVSSGNTAHVAAARTTLFDLFNAAGSGVVLKVRHVSIQPTLAAVTGVGQTYELIRTSAVGTGGASATPQNYDSASAALPAQVTARTKPTGGATTAATLLFVNGSSEETTPYAALASQLNHIAGAGASAVEPLVLRAGEGLKVDQTTSSAVGSVNVVVVFTRE